MDDVIVDFSDSDGSIDENLKSCSNESTAMMTQMKKDSEAPAPSSSHTPRTTKRHKWELNIPASTRHILAAKLEDYLDQRIEITNICGNDDKSIVSHRKKFKLSSSSTVKFRDSDFIDSYYMTVKRKSIPLHSVDSGDLKSSVAPEHDITNLLNSIEVKHV